jgi:cytochrome P450 family 142 subfamily A polypeptide 1
MLEFGAVKISATCSRATLSDPTSMSGEGRACWERRSKLTVPSPPWADLNLLDGAWYARDPHAVWTWMRHEAPVYWDPLSEVWGIARYDDVLAIEKDPQTFSSHRAPRPHGTPLPMMISMDNPEHQRRRSLVNRGFTPRRIADHEANVREHCRTIFNAICERGECDFVWDVAAPLPLLMIADMLGFEKEMHAELLRWSDDLIRGTTIDPTPEVAGTALNAMLGFREYQLGVIAARRREPRQDLISALCEATVDGERLDDESIVQESLLILIGGDETTRHVISGGMLALLDEPRQLDDLRHGRVDMVVAVEELLRWVSPVKNMARTVVRDVVVRGEELHEGDQLMLFYPSANRDEDVFTGGDVLDIRRQPNPHIAFGFGPHFCLGAALARLELRIMFQEAIRRLPELELVGGDLLFRESNFISGPEAMPVRFSPTSPEEAA